MKKFMNLVFGLVLGGFVGSTLALLLTPVSGEELKNSMRDYSNQVKNEVEHAASARRVEMERELANLRGEVITD
jgi:gas vesicle protein